MKLKMYYYLYRPLYRKFDLLQDKRMTLLKSNKEEDTIEFYKINSKIATIEKEWNDAYYENKLFDDDWDL